MVLPAAQNRHETPVEAKARATAQERVWNLVWFRRVVYFATVFATLYLLLYPLFRIFPRVDEFSTSFRPVSDLIRLVGTFVPSAFEPWLNAYARGPGQFLIALAIVAVLTLLGSTVGAKITDGMRGIWISEAPVAHGGPLHELIYGLRTSRPYQWVLWALKRHLVPFAFAVLVVYLTLTFASHILFNIQDAAGWVCQERLVEYQHDARHPNRITVKDYKGLVNLNRGETMLADGKASTGAVADTNTLPVFHTSELCQSTGVWLESGGKYLIKFDSTDDFKDGDIDASEGFYSTSPRSWLQSATMLAAVPLRRELFKPWFRVVARTGGKGGEESFIDPDFTDRFLINAPITATRDGELFLFVNDAVIGIPGFSDYFYKFFYRNNEGSARVTIKRL